MQIKVKASSSRKCHNFHFSNSFSTRLIFLSLSDTLILPREALSCCPTQLTIIFMILHLYMSWQTLKLQIWKTQQGNLLGSPSTTNWMTFWRFPRGVLAWPGPRGWGVGESFPIKKKYVADLLCSKRICWSLDTYKTWL